MKKIITTIILVTVIYSCENYDDQFDSLEKKIAFLTDQIQSLSSLSNDVIDLNSEITKLASTVVQNNSSIEEEIDILVERIDGIKANIQEVIADMPDVTGIETEVADLNAEIIQILETLESLKGVKDFYGHIYIDDIDDLVTAEGLFLSNGEDSPMIAVWGDVEIDIDEGDELDSKEMVDRINAILAKVVAVYDRDEDDDTDDDGDGDVSVYNESHYAVIFPKLTVASYGIYDSTGRVFFPELKISPYVEYYAYVNDAQDKFFPADSIQFLFPKITHVEDLEIYGIDGELRLPQIVSVDDTLILDSYGATPTLIDISNIIIDENNYNGESFEDFDENHTHSLTYFNIGEYPLGGGDDELVFIAEGAQVITSMETTYDYELDISVPNGSITFLNPIYLDEDIDLIQSKSDVILSIKDGDTDGQDIKIVSAGNIELNNIVDSDNLILTASGTISLDALATGKIIDFSGNELTDGGYTIEIPQLSMSNLTGDLKMPNTGAHTLNVASFDISNYNGNEIAHLTVGSQAGTLDLSGTKFVNTIKSLSYTGSQTTPIAPGVQSNVLNITNTISLTSVAIIGSSYLGTLNVVSNTALESLNSAGAIISTVVASNTALTSLNFGHTYLSGENALSVSVSNNHSITTLNLSSLQKIKTIMIDNNTSLSSIDGPGSSVLLEPTASISLTITNNAFQGTYDDADAATETTVYVPATGSALVVDAFKPFINAYLAQTRTGAVSFTISIDEVDADADGDFDDGDISNSFNNDTAAQAGADGVGGNDDDQSNGGAIDTVKELNIF